MSALRAPLRALFADPFTIARGVFEELPVFLGSQEGQGMTHSDLEAELGKRGQELLRTLYQGWLDQQQAAGGAQVPVVDADGDERTRERDQSRELSTVFGTVIVRRTGYGAEGRDSLHPLDAKLNLPEERYSFQLRRRAAEEASKNSFDEVVATLAAHTGTPVPKRQVEELVQRAAQDFDAFYAARQAAAGQEAAFGPEPEANAPEANDRIVVISADGKGVVMRREDLRDETRALAEKDRTTLRTRVTRAERNNRKRMATVATVYTVAPYVRTPEQAYQALAREPGESGAVVQLPRPRPENKRVWASLERTPADVIEETFQEATSRDPGRTRVWAAIVDGNEHQLDLLEQASQRHAMPVTIVVDLFHVLGYVWHAGRALEGESDERTEPWVLERMRRILHGDAVMVAAGMRRSATRRGLTPQQRHPVDECADYLLKYRNYLAYDDYLAAGLPIASGVIEGACRHLVKDRMAITGARWRLRGAEAVLRLRALRSSGDFDEYWRFHEACEYDRNHRAKYAGGQPPSIGVALDSSPPPRPGA